MVKEIHIQLSEKSWNKLNNLRKEIEKDMPEFMKEKNQPKTYEEYLQREKDNPTMALFG